MQDLLEDLQETKTSSIFALGDIKDKYLRECCQEVVLKTLNSIINRIETELLEKEKQVNEHFYEQGHERGNEVTFQDYYNQKYKQSKN